MARNLNQPVFRADDDLTWPDMIDPSQPLSASGALAPPAITPFPQFFPLSTCRDLEARTGKFLATIESRR